MVRRVDVSAPKIRPATRADVVGLKRCIDAAYSIYADTISDLPDVSGGLIEDIQNNLVFVAEMDRMIVGGIILGAHDDGMHLANIAVSPQHMGHGIGRELLETADAAAKRLGYAKMQLSTHIDMPQNVALYTRLGWHETGRTDNKVSMAKTL